MTAEAEPPVIKNAGHLVCSSDCGPFHVPGLMPAWPVLPFIFAFAVAVRLVVRSFRAARRP